MPRNYTPRVACICDGCGKTIMKKPSSVGARNFCGNACRHTGTKKTCVVCGAEYEVEPRRAATSQYCSVRCRGVAKRRPLADRFFEKLDRSAGPDSCWVWTGASQVQGYGTIYVPERGEKIRATHVAWFLEHGVWPELFMCHRCDNPSCCNPRHLFEGDALVNNRDAASKGRLPLGAEHSNTVLTDDEVRVIRMRFQCGERVSSIAKSFPQAAYTTVWKIAREKKRLHVH